MKTVIYKLTGYWVVNWQIYWKAPLGWSFDKVWCWYYDDFHDQGGYYNSYLCVGPIQIQMHS